MGPWVTLASPWANVSVRTDQKDLDKSSERVFSGLVSHAQVAPNASHSKHNQLERSRDCSLRPEGIETSGPENSHGNRRKHLQTDQQLEAEVQTYAVGIFKGSFISAMISLANPLLLLQRFACDAFLSTPVLLLIDIQRRNDGNLRKHDQVNCDTLTSLLIQCSLEIWMRCLRILILCPFSIGIVSQ